MLLINISNAVQWVILRFCSSCFVFYISLIPCMKLELPYLVAFSFSTVTSVYIGDIMSFSLLCGWLNVKSPRTNSLFVCFRNNTLTFWDDKTRLASKKFKSFNSFNTSVLKQVEQVSLGNPLLCPQYARAHYAYPPLPPYLFATFFTQIPQHQVFCDALIMYLHVVMKQLTAYNICAPGTVDYGTSIKSALKVSKPSQCWS